MIVSLLVLTIFHHFLSLILLYRFSSYGFNSLKNIHLAFGTAPILDGVHFTLKPNERVCLIGRNGEGKSTLFKLIMRQIHADDGEVLIKDGTKLPCWHKMCQMSRPASLTW